MTGPIRNLGCSLIPSPTSSALASHRRFLPTRGATGICQASLPIVLALGDSAWLGDVAWLCCLTFLICSAWRLARFNVQGMAPGGSKNFVGMPTPAAAGVVAAIVHACHWIGPITDKNWAIAWFILMVALGVLMTSAVRYYSFKDIPWALNSLRSRLFCCASSSASSGGIPNMRW